MLLEAGLQSPLGLPNVLEPTRIYKDLVYHSSLPQERYTIVPSVSPLVSFLFLLFLIPCNFY